MNMNRLTRSLLHARMDLVHALDPDHHCELRRGLVNAMRTIREATAREEVRDAAVWNILSTIEGALIQDDMHAVQAFTEHARARLDGLLVGYAVERPPHPSERATEVLYSCENHVHGGGGLR